MSPCITFWFTPVLQSLPTLVGWWVIFSGTLQSSIRLFRGKGISETTKPTIFLLKWAANLPERHQMFRIFPSFFLLTDRCRVVSNISAKDTRLGAPLVSRVLGVSRARVYFGRSYSSLAEIRDYSRSICWRTALDSRRRPRRSSPPRLQAIMSFLLL